MSVERPHRDLLAIPDFDRYELDSLLRLADRMRPRRLRSPAVAGQDARDALHEGRPHARA